MKTTLIEDVRAAYADRPKLREMIDEETIRVLGLTQPEVTMLCALLINEGCGWEALTTALNEGLNKRVVEMAAKGLEERGLIARDTVDPKLWHFDGAERALRMQTEEEADREVAEVSAALPSPKLTLRPLREQVIYMARQQNVVAVYTFLFGKPSNDEYGIINLMGKELGKDEAALFLLAHAHQQFRSPAKELIGLARAQAKGFRPADAPDEDEQRDYMAAIAAQARRKRGG